MMLRATLALSVVLTACSPGAPTSTASPPAESKTPVTEVKTPGAEVQTPGAEAKPSSDVKTSGADADAVLAKICAAAPCAGPFGRVEVLRKDGKIVAYLHFGDIRRCSHPPSVYFDAAGAELGAIPEKPVAPDSEEARHFEAERQRLSQGGTKAETLSCPDR